MQVTTVQQKRTILAPTGQLPDGVLDAPGHATGQ